MTAGILNELTFEIHYIYIYCIHSYEGSGMFLPYRSIVSVENPLATQNELHDAFQLLLECQNPRSFWKYTAATVES